MKLCSRFAAWIMDDPGNYYLKTVVLMALGFVVLVGDAIRRTVRGD